MLFGIDGLNYKQLIWRFYVPHPFETSRHRFKLYFEFNNKFLGVL